MKTPRKRWVISNQRLWFCVLFLVCRQQKQSTLERMKLPPSYLCWGGAYRLQSALKLCCARRSTNIGRDNPPAENNLKSNQKCKTQRGETKMQRRQDLAALRQVSGRAGERVMPPALQASTLATNSYSISKPGSSYATNLLLIILYVLLLPERLWKNHTSFMKV